MPTFEFHVSRRIREAHGLEAPLFGLAGNVILADFAAARALAARLNAGRPAVRAVRPGGLNALGLIDELQHLAVRAYRTRVRAGVFGEARVRLADALGEDAVERTLLAFVDEFPPSGVYGGRLTASQYLDGATEGLSHRDVVLEEMLLLRLANLNPAFAPLRELFDDRALAAASAYLPLMDRLRDFLAEQPGFGPGGLNLYDFLRAPALAAPDSLAGQLEFIRANWAPVLGDVGLRVLRGEDFLREEERAAFSGPGPSQGPALVEAGAQSASLALFGAAGEGGGSGGAADVEYERFSPDLDWMPHLVLIAKNAYVWLDQLSKTHGREIRTLDGIPDAELDRLRDAGITGLWLIGVWERSKASERIKRLMGNPEAVASAYSLFDYAVAADLGGEAALHDLKARAMRRGIRLASDMVPNHMGVDSRWVIEHPEWFLSLDAPPFPAYRFTGPDLSWDARVGLQIEDRYWDRADAAVVFKRTDRWTGQARYIYHGNDGTSFPWNDTAQIDYLNPEAREAVIRTILHVARLFPVIRFDAAMTLARRHVQRLWFPEPGAGGAIPSRAERGLTRAAFDAAMPHEFWREVVDRVAAEAPDTLLLAEAFWLMEGYFVRTLGMHRVYNSAFMNMLRDEDNAKYRQVIKNTLEFDPDVLKRYVNFMSNPDERTAIEQFGDGDKYFGVCTLLATLPGLPMVGHGQIEGFAEKYGMEYRRAYYDETPKPWLVEGHGRRIFPLFHRRRLFAGVERFRLYDAFREDGGGVDENVFAYSNGEAGGEGADGARALVVYHNKYAETAVWIRTSAAFAEKGSGDGEKTLVRKDLGDSLAVPDDPAAWVIFRERFAGLEYLRNARELWEKGLRLELRAYECRVYLDFRIVRDEAETAGAAGTAGTKKAEGTGRAEGERGRSRARWAEVAGELGGQGVPDVEGAAREFHFRPVSEPFREFVHAGFFRWLLAQRAGAGKAGGSAVGASGGANRGAVLNPEPGMQAAAKAGAIARGVMRLTGLEGGQCADAAREAVGAAVRRDVEAILRLACLGAGDKPARRYLSSALEAGDGLWLWLFGWAAIRAVGTADRIERWQLGPILATAARDAGLDQAEAGWMADSLRALAPYRRWYEAGATAEETIARLAATLFAEPAAERALGVNEYRGVRYFNKEAFERLLARLMAIAAVDATADPKRPAAEVTAALASAYEAIELMREAESRSNYDFAAFLKSVTVTPFPD